MRVWWRDLGLACLSGLLLLLSFPDFDLSLLAWIALVPLLVALDGKPLLVTLALSYVTGAVFFVGIFDWIWSVSAYNVIDEILLAGYLAQYLGCWALGLTWIRRRTGLSAAVVAPPLWVGLEYVRAHLSFLALPWMLLGHSQYAHPSLIQVASFTGVYGLSFLIVLINAACAETLRHACAHVLARASRSASSFVLGQAALMPLMLGGALLIADSLYGLSVLSAGADGERVAIALLQGNIPQDRKWDASSVRMILERYSALTRSAARQRPLVIVWPETAVPGDVMHHRELKRQLSELAVATNQHLLVGSAEYAKFTDREFHGNYYNSMFLFSPDGAITGQYRKIVLVPFGEYEPLRGIVTWPAAMVRATGAFVPGNQYTLFTIGHVKFAAVICWEAIFPDLVRQFVKRGARLIVNATNEAWFLESAAPYQLLAMSLFRAVENRVAVVRAGNTGVTAIIDPFGRITARLKDADQRDVFMGGILVGAVPLSQTVTFYTRYGDIFAFAQIAACLLLLVRQKARDAGADMTSAVKRDDHVTAGRVPGC